MNNNLPRISKAKNNKTFQNNNKYYYSVNNGVKEVKKENTSFSQSIKSVEQTLKELFSSSHHTFSVPVKITTDKLTYNTKIIGKFGNKIFTTDDEEINIDEIKSIIILQDLTR